MTLRKKMVDLPFIDGINQKISQKLLLAPNLLELENGRYLKEGKISKRYGYTNLGQEVNTGTLNTPAAIESIRDELLMASADSLYTYAAKDSTWYKKGELSSGRTEISQVSGSPTTAKNIDVMSKNGIRCVVWAEDQYYYSVIDENTGSAIVDKAVLYATVSGTSPRLIATQSDIFILYNDTGTNLVYVQVPTTNPSATTTGNLFTDLHSNGSFDAVGTDTHFYVLYRVDSTSNCDYARVIPSTLTADLTQTITGADPSSSKELCLYSYFSTSENKTIINLAYPVSSALKAHATDVVLTFLYSAQSITTAGTWGQITIGQSNSDGSEVKYFMTTSAASASDDYVRESTVDTDGNVSGEGVFMRSVSIASKVLYKDGVGYFNVVHSSDLQSTYFTVTSDGKVVAKFTAGQSGDESLIHRPSNFALTSTANTYVCGVLKKGRIISGSGATLYAVLNPYFGTLELSGAKSFTSTKVNDDFLIGGGILRSYDGQSATEYGFHLYPEGVTVGETTGGSLPTTTGPYSFQVIYEWTDARGVRFQSAPSIAVTHTLTASNDRIQITVPSLRITDKSGDTALTSRAPVKIRVFMTDASETVHHFAAETDNPDITTTDSVTINIDTVAAPSAELLYTTGGVIENIAAPSHRYLFTHDNRIILVGTENPNQIRFGKDIKPLTGVGFNEDFSINLDPLGGKIISGASMDNYMIIFKESATYAIAGAGPNDLGIGSTYSAPQLISSDIGCKDLKSIVQTPDGLILKTNKGIYLLSRSLKYAYIGANVEDFNSSEVISSDILKDSNEIRFVTDNNITLVYNYYFDRWSTFTTPGALDATTWQDSKYVYLTSTKVMQEDSTTYLDDGSYVRTKIRTGWIKLSTMQGYQRVYRAALIGEYHTNHIFQVKQYYNYSDIVKGTTSITANTLVNTATFGDSATFGDDDYFGGSENDEVYQTRIHLSQQKCESISFEIIDSIQGSNIGQGFSLEGLSLQVGGKAGIFKSSTTRTK